MSLRQRNGRAPRSFSQRLERSVDANPELLYRLQICLLSTDQRAVGEVLYCSGVRLKTDFKLLSHGKSNTHTRRPFRPNRTPLKGEGTDALQRLISDPRCAVAQPQFSSILFFFWNSTRCVTLELWRLSHPNPLLTHSFTHSKFDQNCCCCRSLVEWLSGRLEPRPQMSS